jgi:hypothetical protein
VLDFSGFRKAEWTLSAGDKRKGRRFKGLKFRNVAFRFDSEREVPTRNPTMAQLKSMRINQSWVFLYPGASKADPDGSIFGTKAIPFLYTGEDSVAAAIRDLAIDALNDGLTGDTYVDRALFADEKGMPLEASHMDDALRDAFIALRVAPEQSRKHSWHSYRIRLACKLRAAKKDDHTIQACVRWRSTKALDIYARFEPRFYWSLLMDTVQHDATSVEISTLPELDEGRRLIALRDSTLEQILRPSSPESSALHPESQAAAEIQRQRILGTGHPVGSSGAGSSTDPLPIPAPATGQLPVNAADKRIPPPGYQKLIQKATARDYTVYVAPDGRKLPSLPQAWRHYEELPSRPAAPLVQPSGHVPRAATAGAQGANGDAYNLPPLYRVISSQADRETSGSRTQVTGVPTRHGLAPRREAPVLPAARRPSRYVPAVIPLQRGETQRAPAALTRLCGTPGCGLPDFHDGPCANAVRVGRRPPPPFGRPSNQKRRSERGDTDGDGPFSPSSMYESVRLRGGTPSSGWSSDSDEEPPTVPRPNFDDGPIHWPAGVTKPISSAWPWQPLPADDLQSNFSIDTNDQRCIETGVRITKRLLKRRAFPAVLTKRSLILDAYPDFEAANIPKGLAGSCMWNWLQCALQRVATFATVTKRAEHLKQLRTKLRSDTFGVLGTLYPQVMQRKPERLGRKDILLWHNVCVDLQITCKWMNTHGLEMFGEDMTLVNLYKFIMRMASRVSNLRLSKTAQAHSEGEYGNLAEQAFNDARIAFRILSDDELKCHQAFLHFEVTFRREADFRQGNSAETHYDVRLAHPPAGATCTCVRPSSPGVDDSRLRALKRSTMMAQKEFLWAQLNANHSRLRVFKRLQTLYHLDRCLRMGMHRWPTERLLWKCNSTAVVAEVAMYYNHVLQYTMQNDYLTIWHGILSNQYANIMFNYNDDSQARAEDYTLVKNLICIYFLRGSDASFWNT